MELFISTSLTPSRPVFYPLSSTFDTISHPLRRRKLIFRSSSANPALPGVESSSGRDNNAGNDIFPIRENDKDLVSRESWEDPGFVEVIGIGSRKDSVFDYCISWPLRFLAVRFWNILVKDGMRVELQQKFPGEDAIQSAAEGPTIMQSRPKAAILVASAAYGLENVAACDIIKKVKCASGLSACIILKPFSFEGRRRQDEVMELIDGLEKHTNLFIVVDTDALLEKDLVTLDEALKTANNAVLMAIIAISVLVSERHLKFLDLPHKSMKELKVPELIKILEKCREAKIGFGAGYNINASIAEAIECPFLSVALKDFSGLVVCILASSEVINCSDVHASLSTFRHITECKADILVSMIHEPSLDPNQILVTIITMSYIKDEVSGQSLFSRLAQHFPFISNFFREHHQHSYSTGEICSHECPYGSGEMVDEAFVDDTIETIRNYSSELQISSSNNDDELDYTSSFEENAVEFSEANIDMLSPFSQNTEGGPNFQRQMLVRQSLGPGNQIEPDWVTTGATGSGASTPVLDNLRTFELPVGVKSSEGQKDDCDTSHSMYDSENTSEDDMKSRSQVSPKVFHDAFKDVGFEAAMDLYSSASALLNGIHSDSSRKQGALSARAASMLDAERDKRKNWNPVVVIKYRGGVYKGRCQGGLPEGKGRLSHEDGSAYDGTWRSGKRSGLGTFYFSNGDVFQGSWRDDVMHGKGWFYFHSGDRWFVNFWKGKANGEGRFYSKFGNVLFGHFKDGWRHGHFLCINVDGARFAEIWDEGVLVNRKQLDSAGCTD